MQLDTSELFYQFILPQRFAVSSKKKSTSLAPDHEIDGYC